MLDNTICICVGEHTCHPTHIACNPTCIPNVRTWHPIYIATVPNIYRVYLLGASVPVGYMYWITYYICWVYLLGASVPVGYMYWITYYMLGISVGCIDTCWVYVLDNILYLLGISVGRIRTCWVYVLDNILYVGYICWVHRYLLGICIG